MTRRMVLCAVSVAGLAVNLMGLVFVHEAHNHGVPSHTHHHDSHDSQAKGML